MNDRKTTYHRHLLHCFSLVSKRGEDKWLAYNFVRKVYDDFAPVHLKRIRDALPYLRDSKLKSSMSVANTDAGSQVPDSQSMPPPSKVTTGSKRTNNTVLQQQLEKLQQQLKKQREESVRQREEMKEEFDRQRREKKEENAGLKKENAGLRAQLNKLLDRLTAPETKAKG